MTHNTKIDLSSNRTISFKKSVIACETTRVKMIEGGNEGQAGDGIFEIRLGREANQ